MTRVVTRRNRVSCRFGVSSTAPSAPATRCFLTLAGTLPRMPLAFRISRASAKRVGSGTVGPEAIVDGSSPTTSDSTRQITRAGAAALASPPPLSLERCFRTVLSSRILAPESIRSEVAAALSSREMPGVGAGKSAEAPPDSSTSSTSSRSSDRAIASTSCAAASPLRSGRGWPAISSRPRGRRIGVEVQTASAVCSRSPRTRSASAAIVAAALPAATRTRRPSPSRSVSPATARLAPRRPKLRRTSRAGSAASRPLARTLDAARRKRRRFQRVTPELVPWSAITVTHRERRGARGARREEGAYREYATDEQRSQAGCIGGRMPPYLRIRALSARPVGPARSGG